MTAPRPPSKAAQITGLTLTTLAAIFLLLDGAAKIARLQPVVEGSVSLGFSEGVILPLGVILVVATVLYVLPRTSVFGAVLLTGYLGGAVATHVRMGHPLLTHALFPVYLGVMIWLGLVLRDPVLRSRLPARPCSAC